MKIIHGYRLKSTSMKDVIRISEAVRARLEKAWEELYATQLADETAYVADTYVLETEQYDPGQPVLEIARNVLDNRIAFAIKNDAPVTYNYRVRLEWLYDQKNVLYIHVVSCNDVLLEHLFDDLDGLEKYSVAANEGEMATGRFKLWTDLPRKFPDEKMPFIQDAVPNLPIKIDEKKLVFPEPYARAIFHAESRERNLVLSLLTGGQPISPNHQMRYINQMLAEMEGDYHTGRVHTMTNQLCAILPELNYEIVTGALGVVRLAREKDPENEAHGTDTPEAPETETQPYAGPDAAE